MRFLAVCQACGKDLPNPAPPPCPHCRTPYCSDACREEHWLKHKSVCRSVVDAGGAEKHYARYRAREAAGFAASTYGVESGVCAVCPPPDDRPERRDRYKLPEPLVRACGCPGPQGLARISSLAARAQAETEIFGDERAGQPNPWQHCRRCQRPFHGAVRLALAWLAWITYCDKPERSSERVDAMAALGVALHRNGRYAEAVVALEGYVAALHQFHPHALGPLLAARDTLASCHGRLGRSGEALRLRRELHDVWTLRAGAETPEALVAANNLASALLSADLVDEATPFLRGRLAAARDALGPDHEVVLVLSANLARAVLRVGALELEHVEEAAALLKEALYASWRVLGVEHVRSLEFQALYNEVKEKLKAFQPEE